MPPSARPRSASSRAMARPCASESEMMVELLSVSVRGGSEAAVAGECREDVVVVGGGGGEALALGIVSSRDI